MGFCWRSLVTFCRYWQKVTRRRHVPYAKESTERKLPAGGTKEKLLGKVGRRRHVPYAKESTERKLLAGGKKEKLLTKSMPPAGKQKTAIERTHLTGGKKSTGTSARSIRVRHQPPRRFGTADA